MSDTASYIVTQGRNIVLRTDGQAVSEQDCARLEQFYPNLTRYYDRTNNLTTIGLPAQSGVPEGYRAFPLRSYFAAQPTAIGSLAFRAKALVEWRESTHFCTQCGSALSDDQTLTARVCPQCQRLFFPRIDPCIIVLVKKEGKFLLARHVQRNQDIYACIAGFIEAGESAEHAVAREVFEETGIRVRDICYRASQSWPFPGQLMLGFTAEYDSGEFRFQPDEIADAQWFDPDNLPPSPSPGSLAYRLIHEFA
ncbi:MAG: NAD(+) diphosphatase [Paludibacteraceae bacterium]|nr:NAD(+) diphosphatase [Paludibacteraceae bacterium]